MSHFSPKVFVLCVLVCLAQTPFWAKTSDTIRIKEVCQDVHESWLQVDLELTKQTPGYSAPVAARTFCYLSIGMYESSVEILPLNQSLSGQILGWNRKSWNTNDSKIKYAIVANEVDYILTNFYFVNMPPSSKKKVAQHYLKWDMKLRKRISKKNEAKSKRYAVQLANEIISWSKKDNADECWNKNFSLNFQEKVCDGCWTKTFPGFSQALQPYWGQNRPMLNSNTRQSNDLKPIPFSRDSSSAFYAENKKIVAFYKTINRAQKSTAKYWDDSPGVSGTPVGHLYSIALQTSMKHNLSFAKELELFAALGIALNDALIESWRLKYQFSVIRPITYIQQNIDSKFTTAIATPPFPEFPSGHSFQSGVGAEILNSYFGDSTSFTDETNVNRIDINGLARNYTNFTEMSKEMSLSRFYGGIHYDFTLKQSLIYGRKIGENTLSQIQFQKK